jgi:ketosteroid isomerase-like protein
MTDQEIKDAIRGFLKAWTAGDTKQALSFFAADAVLISPFGTSRGISQIEKNITWVNKITKDYKITETGIGIITQGDTGVIEHKISGISNGKKWESPAMCIYEFKNGKIANVRSFYDILGQAQQIATGIGKWMVNMVVNASQKGLK